MSISFYSESFSISSKSLFRSVFCEKFSADVRLLSKFMGLLALRSGLFAKFVLPSNNFYWKLFAPFSKLKGFVMSILRLLLLLPPKVGIPLLFKEGILLLLLLLPEFDWGCGTCMPGGGWSLNLLFRGYCFYYLSWEFEREFERFRCSLWSLCFLCFFFEFRERDLESDLWPIFYLIKTKYKLKYFIYIYL